MARHPLSPRGLLLAVLLPFALPAHAGVFDADAMAAVNALKADHEKRLAEQSARLDKLEAALQNQLEFNNQLSALKDEVAQVRGQVEVLSFEMEQANKRQRDFYVDLDTRLRKLETQQSAQTAAPQPPKVDPAAEARDFENGLNLFKSENFKDAAAAFQSFIQNYPASTLAPGAYYWGGNALFQLKDWPKAAEMYASLAGKWPDDAKAPEALLKEADAQQHIPGGAKAARKTLESVLSRYPDNPAAKIAKQRLGRKK